MDAPADKGDVYILDEPTLHLADVDNLLRMLDRLVDVGRSVIVIEHHQAVMAHADWIIDLGPGAGHDGGRSTLTGERLATEVRGEPSSVGVAGCSRTCTGPSRPKRWPRR